MVDRARLVELLEQALALLRGSEECTVHSAEPQEEKPAAASFAEATEARAALKASKCTIEEPQSFEAFKALEAEASRERCSQVTHKLGRQDEFAFMDELRDELPAEVAVRDGGKWRKRYREEPDKCRRVLEDFKAAKKQAERGMGPQIRRPGAFLENSWRMFA